VLTNACAHSELVHIGNNFTSWLFLFWSNDEEPFADFGKLHEMNCMWIRGGLWLCDADCEQLLRLYNFMCVSIRYVNWITVDILSPSSYVPRSAQSCDEPGYASPGHVWQKLIRTLCRGTVPIWKCGPQNETHANHYLLPSLQQNSTLRTDADHVQHISTESCKHLEDSLLWNLMKIIKHVWKNQHQNDATYNKSCTLSGLVCLEIVLVLISNYKHFIPFYRKADFDKLLDSCITIYFVLGNWSWHILQDICHRFALTIMMLQALVRRWISQCCSNSMLQINVQ
jgi:hypothetical protein